MAKCVECENKAIGYIGNIPVCGMSCGKVVLMKVMKRSISICPKCGADMDLKIDDGRSWRECYICHYIQDDAPEPAVSNPRLATERGAGSFT